jgi:glyoxylase-like metal-dependent hydrolase (beta-lactamase superfamily II)
MNKLWIGLASIVMASVLVRAQSLPPGYVDPAPLLAAASKEIGEANLRCITFSGTGYDGAVGQTAEYNPNIDWPRIDALSNYTRTINWETGTSKETFDRKPGLNPASWKYGLGWRGGTPLQKHARQTHIVNGAYAWYVDGEGGQPVAVPAEDAERYQLDLWLNPPGFLKAARLPGANPKAIWRWEQIEMGRDGNVVMPEKMHVVSIMMLGKYRVEATINAQNQIQRIKTTVNEPALGDFNIEQESTEQTTFGNVKWPIAWHSHQGWDDNYQFDNVSLGGSTHNSYMIEFRDFVAVFEAPDNEARSLAVIEEIVKLAPGKPIRWLISSHPHFDHIGGVRTYLHIGSTIVAHRKWIDFLNRDVLSYRPRTVAPDIVALWPPTELSEGYNFEAINENYVITDNSRILRIYYVQPLAHVAGMLMAYLPAERIAIEADLFDTHEPPPAAPTPAMRSFFNQVRRMKLDVATIAPVHGAPVPWSTFVSAMGTAAR